MEPRIWASSHLAGSVLRFETHRIIKRKTLVVPGEKTRAHVGRCYARSAIRSGRGRAESRERASACCDAFACAQSTMMTQPLQSVVRPSAEPLTIADSDPHRGRQ